MELPGNSYNVVGPGKNPGKPKPEKEAVQKVVSVAVVKRKTPIGKRLKNLFVGGEAREASRYVTGDVLIPALRNMVVDATTRGIERVIYGENRPRNRIEPGRPRISYNSPVDRYNQQPMMLPGQPPRYARTTRQDVGEFIIGTREEAELVVERLKDILDKYEVASLVDYYDLLDVPSSHVDNKWGWTSLRGITVQQIREGYVINLPPLEPL